MLPWPCCVGAGRRLWCVAMGEGVVHTQGHEVESEGAAPLVVRALFCRREVLTTQCVCCCSWTTWQRIAWHTFMGCLATRVNACVVRCVDCQTKRLLCHAYTHNTLGEHIEMLHSLPVAHHLQNKADYETIAKGIILHFERRKRT